MRTALDLVYLAALLIRPPLLTWLRLLDQKRYGGPCAGFHPAGGRPLPDLWISATTRTVDGDAARASSSTNCS